MAHVALLNRITVSKKDIPLICWGVYVFSFPIYLFGSGGLQISSFFLVICLAATFLIDVKPGLYAQYRIVILSLISFVALVFTVNLISYYIYHSFAFLFFCLFYLYNMTVFVLGLYLYHIHGVRFLKATIYGAMASYVGCVMLSPLAPAVKPGIDPLNGEAYRQVFFFNNANQFGEFSMLVAMCILVGMAYGWVRKLFGQIAIGIITVLSLLTLSRASVAGMGVLFFFALPWRYVAILGSVALAIFLMFSQQIKVITDLEQRFELVTTQNNIDQRQINRLFNYPAYNILGSGEAPALNGMRFGSVHEISCTILSMLFCYGITGVILFIVFLYQIFAELYWKFVLYFGPLFLFESVENGVRFTLTWIVLVLFLGVTQWQVSRRTKGPNHQLGLPARSLT